MAHTLDTTYSDVTGPTTNPLTFSYTAASGVTLIILSIMTERNARTGGAPTFDGVTMVQAGSTETSTESKTEIWYLVSSITTGSSITVSIPNSGSASLHIGMTSWTSSTGASGLDVVAGISNQSSTNPTLSATPTVTNGVMQDCMGSGEGLVPTGNNRTLIAQADTGSSTCGFQYYLSPPASSTAMSWTLGSDDWSMVVACFKETSAPTVPTIVLDTADHYDFGADDTPTLEFTGSDTGGEDLTYNIQIDTNATFDSGVSVAEEESYDGGTTSGSLYSTVSRYGFEYPGEDTIIDSLEFNLKKTGSPTGTITAEIYASDGLAAAEPTGSALATSDTINCADTSGTFTYETFDFTGADRITLASGTDYFIVINGDGMVGDVTNNVVVEYNNLHVAYEFVRWTGSAWQNINGMLNFVLNTETGGALIDALSETDLGFSNVDTPADTDPFTEDEQIDYTVQGGDALADDTYYWRVRVKDPSDTDTWTAWATTRDFDIGGTTPTVRYFIIS